jgi:hypothetical protein
MKVMQLKHLNLTTSDVSGLAAFFERFFAFRRALERGSGAFTILNNDEDFVLTLMKANSHDPVGYPETFHVGFYLDDPAAVHIKHDELAAAGLAPGEIQGGRNMRGTHFYCIAPGNVSNDSLERFFGRHLWRPLRPGHSAPIASHWVLD